MAGPARRSATVRALAGDRRGSAAVEFGLVAIPLCMMIYGVAEFGRLMWTVAALNYAVEQSARCAAFLTTTCSSSSATATYAANLVSPTYIPASTYTLTSASCGYKVSASFAYTFVASGLFPETPTLTASACYP